MALKVASAFDKMVPYLKEKGQEVVKKVGFVYHFEIAPAKGQAPVSWTVDLKNGSGSIKNGKEGKADATFALVDQDAVDLFDGKLNPQTAFMQGKMKIKGNMQAAMKFTPDLFPKGSL
jgi:3-hydroxyacyl-CoA dehydrogenase/3a,7a,12a-trihydroxy-5b-cholest-24-enoyl-CoA hydratase